MIDKITNLGISNIEAKELLKVSKDIESDYKKLLNKYPIQYLIGYVNFYGYKINVNENTLIPRYETEYLVEKTITLSKRIFNDKVKILDIGTGSGAIAISLSKNLNSEVTACDISEECISLAKQNSVNNETNIEFIKSDIFQNIKDKYDIIISNPPYIDYNEKIMDSVYMYEPHLALFAEDSGLYFYKKILSECKKYLNDKFLIAFEIGYQQSKAITEYARTIFRTEKIITEKDLSGKDRYIFIISE
jgi:release factor glutamine methyltransferase